MNKPLNKKILETIESQNIQPRSKQRFKIREIILWVGIGISLVLASMSVGSFIFQSVNNLLLPPNLHILFAGIRIILIVLFLALAIFQILRTDKGYRRRNSIYLLIGTLIITIIGFFFFITQATSVIESALGRGGVLKQGKEYWSQPEKTGLLAGEMVEITDQGYVVFEALDQSVHVLDIVEIEKSTILIDFLRVQMVGYEDNGIYYPCVVVPWKVTKGRPEKRLEYGSLRDGNIAFSRENISINHFKQIFERKSEIIRNKSC